MAKLTKVKCKNCNKIFYRPTSRFNEAIKFSWNQCCSPKCQSKFRIKRRVLKCENCEKKFERTPNDISPHNYCSSSCAAIVNNKKYDHRRMLPILKTCEQCGKKYKKSLGNKKYCSRKCSMVARCYSKKELLKIIKDIIIKLNHVPGRRYFGNGINDACIKTFGSWNEAVKTAGFTPNRSHDDRMYKRRIVKAEDGHLCDSISEVLIDNWLYKNKILHEKNVSYPNTNHKADWKITSPNKQIFVEYFGLANDSPKYDRSIKEKIKICKRQNISLIAIYPRDLYPKIYLDNNLKNKFKNYLV